MLDIVQTSRFKRDLRRCAKRGKDIDKMESIVTKIQHLKELPVKNRDHVLTGEWNGFRECHIEPDWLLIYKLDEANSLLHLVRTGSHADLFDK